MSYWVKIGPSIESGWKHSAEDSSSYDMVKTAIWRAYENVPSVYLEFLTVNLIKNLPRRKRGQEAV